MTAATPTASKNALPRSIKTSILFVPDFRRAVSFYRDSLELPLRLITGALSESGTAQQADWAEFDCGGFTLAIHGPGRTGGDGEPPRPRDTGLVFHVEDCDETIAALRERGVEIVQGPEPVCDEGRSFAFADCFGNTLHAFGR